VSGGQRVALIAAAVAVGIVAFLVLRPGDDDDAPPPTPVSDGEQEEGDGGTEPAGSETEPKPEVTRIEVEGGAPVGGVERIEVDQGEEVRLVVTADAPAQVHVHGYELLKDVAPGQPARFGFPAELDGGFEVELEGTHVQIAELRVSP
jgi:hypothetical protein